MEAELELKVVPHGSAEYEEIVRLRDRILRAPLGLSFTPEQLAAEAGDIHLAAYREGRLAGCLVLTPVESGAVQMRQVAVDDAIQKRGVGTRLAAFSEEEARRRGFTLMTLHARDTAVPFYLRLGYEVVGEPFEEVTIPHRAMRKGL